MPGIDRLEAVRLLRADLATVNTPVIMVSAQARVEVLRKAKEAKAFDFLVKPWQEGELEWRVKNALEEAPGNAA